MKQFSTNSWPITGSLAATIHKTAKICGSAGLTPLLWGFMRTRSMYSTVIQIASYLFAVIIVCAGCCSCSRRTDVPKALPNPAIPLNVPELFASTDEIKSFFAEKGVPIQIDEILGKTNTYCFVASAPFSGIDNTVLYCFVKCDHGWLLFLHVVLKNGLEYRPDGDFVDVICRGVVALKVNAPK